MAFGVAEAELELRAPNLQLQQLNPGIPIGPISVGGRYSAPVAQIQSGALELEQATASFLGGDIGVEPTVWSLANTPVRVVLDVRKVELSQLMAVYPAEGLAGSGLLSGQVPVLIGPGGVRVDRGQLAAAEPGGTLILPVERIRAFAQGNAAMKLVAEALENFHYSVLNSTINYGQDGTLVLGLHMEGRNPDVQNGQPIELNINLEEDIPALLTSLQLSGRVSDAVTERVRELVRKKGAEGTDKGAINGATKE